VYDAWRPDAGLPWPRRAQARADTQGLASASGFLALGSFLLFVGSGLLLPFGGAPFFTLICFPFFAAVVVHAAAWWILGREAVHHARANPWMFGAFVASLIAFGVSIWGLAWGATPLRAFELALLFPILPWVWAPVVLAHAILFASATRGLSDRRARSWAYAGIFILGVLAGAGLLDQVRIIELGTGVLTFAGWTFVGYLFLASAFNGMAPTPATMSPYRCVRGVAA